MSAESEAVRLPGTEDVVDFDGALSLLDGWIGDYVVVSIETTDPAVSVAEVGGVLRRGGRHCLPPDAPLALRSGQVEFDLECGEGGRGSFTLYRSRFVSGRYALRLKTLTVEIGGHPPGGALAETVVLHAHNPRAAELGLAESA